MSARSGALVQRSKSWQGSMDYLAPELILDSKNGVQWDKVDSWCVGVLIFELLTGKTPFSPSESLKTPTEFSKQFMQNILVIISFLGLK